MSMNNYRLIVRGCTPNVHVTPSGNAHDQNKYFFDLPSLQRSPLGNTFTPFRVVTHLPSSPTSPIQGDPSLGKDSSHQKVKQPRHITIILVITRSWKSIDIIGYQCPTMALLLKCFTIILVHVPIPFVVAANVYSRFQPLNRACSCIPVPST